MFINLIYLNPAPPSFIEDMQIAAAMLDVAIFNPITVNITVGYGVGVPDQGTSVGNIAVPIPMPYPGLYTSLWLHDTASVSALPLAATLDGREFFTIGTAQAKAFGLLDPTDPVIDGAVWMGTNFTGDQLINAGLHEITHAMGRLDSFDKTLTTALDLFRFNGDGSGNRVYDTSIPATQAYFSTDGGTTDLADFGIARDPGDFLNGGVQGDDPFNETVSVATPALTHVDLQIMDDLGFLDDLSSPVEPQSTLPVSTGATATIWRDFLWSVDPDNSDDQIIYTVEALPTHGTILLNGAAATSFTQADINSGLVQYRQNGDVAGNDGFAFQVSDPAGNHTPTEPYTIAIVNTTAPVVYANATVVAAIGSPTMIWKDTLCTVTLGNDPAQMTYSMLAAPAHGTILGNGAVVTRFTQADIDNHLVQYSGNGDGATSDSFTFRATDAAGDQTSVTTYNVAIAGGAQGPDASGQTHASNLALLGQYAAAGFATASDPGGGTIVAYTVPQDGGAPTLLTNSQH